MEKCANDSLQRFCNENTEDFLDDIPCCGENCSVIHEMIELSKEQEEEIVNNRPENSDILGELEENIVIREQIEIPIYFSSLTLIYSENLSAISHEYNLKLNEEEYDGVAFIKNKDEYVLWFNKIDYSVISHEIVHIVNMIFLACHVELDRVNDEPQAYLHGYIFKQVEKFIKKNNLNNGN